MKREKHGCRALNVFASLLIILGFPFSLVKENSTFIICVAIIVMSFILFYLKIFKRDIKGIFGGKSKKGTGDTVPALNIMFIFPYLSMLILYTSDVFWDILTTILFASTLSCMLLIVYNPGYDKAEDNFNRTKI